MKPKQFLLYVLFASLALFYACSNSSNNGEPVFTTSGTKALLVLVENSYIISPTFGFYYPIYKNEIDLQLAQVFGIDEKLLDTMNLEQIIETYGEDWQIKQIQSAAEPFYNKIVFLTDSTASYSAFIDSMKSLANNYNIVDVVLNTHGNENSILFGKDSKTFADITDDFKTYNVIPRVIYQTCCYGASSLTEFTKSGVYSINGCGGENFLSLFAVKLFLESWTGGATFSSAVRYAYNQEISELSTYFKKLGIEEIILTDANKASSIQEVKGRYPNLFFKNLRPI